MLILSGLMTLVLTACQRQDDATETPEPAKTYVLADLALSLPPSPPAASTRMATDVVQADGSFRGIQRLSIIPFTTKGTIGPSDRPTYYQGSEPLPTWYQATGQSVYERFRYYEKFYLMHGVASFLVYGQASQDGTLPYGATAKSYYGSLIPSVATQTTVGFPDRMVVTPSNLNFELEPIYDNTTPSQAAYDIAALLTNIARAEGKVGNTTVTWQNTSNVWLLEVYRTFTNQGNGTANVMAGSARSISKYVDDLMTVMNRTTYDAGTEAAVIVEAIKTKIDAAKTELAAMTYPEDIGLPDGAAVLRWDTTADENKGAFVPQTETTTLANINTISRYAYPAELYYHANSLIKTSNKEVKPADYSGKSDWDAVLDMYSDGTVVSSNTKAVAIEDRLQYGVAQLKAIVQAASVLQDANYRNIEIDAASTKFPVRGIIVCGQWPVDYSFKSKGSGGGRVERFIYDRHLNTNTGNTPYCLKTASTNSPAAGPLQTLVLQSPDNEDVTVILELENLSGQNFTGEDGVIYQGTRFYLVGKIKVDTAAENASLSADVRNRVFTQDHTTEVAMRVNTLAHAYNVLPNVLAGQLEIGVEIKLDWIGATPTNVIFTDKEE